MAARAKNKTLFLFALANGADEFLVNSSGKKAEYSLGNETSRTKGAFNIELSALKANKPEARLKANKQELISINECSTKEFLQVASALMNQLSKNPLTTLVAKTDRITDINQVVGESEETLLHAALYNRKDLFAQALLEMGVDYNKKTTSGITTLMSAAAVGDIKSIKSLIAKGVDVNAMDIEGNTAEKAAEISGKLEAKEILHLAANSKKRSASEISNGLKKTAHDAEKSLDQLGSEKDIIFTPSKSSFLQQNDIERRLGASLKIKNGSPIHSININATSRSLNKTSEIKLTNKFELPNPLDPKKNEFKLTDPRDLEKFKNKFLLTDRLDQGEDKKSHKRIKTNNLQENSHGGK